LGGLTNMEHNKKPIPTAQEFIIIYNSNPQTDSLMVAFAKLHVEAQKEAILKKAFITHKETSNGDEYVIDKDSVNTAYQITNIK